MADLISRDQWAHRPAVRPPHRIPLRQDELWLHHGAAGRSDLRTARAYVDHHIDTNRWRDVGYSWLVADGRVLEGRGPGVAGGHTRTRNTVSYGICMVGSYTVVPPSDGDIDALVWLLRHGVTQGWWARPVLTGGHRDAPGSSTTCPGDALHRTIPYINRRAQEDDMTPEQDARLSAVEAKLDAVIDMVGAVAGQLGGRDVGTDLRRLRISQRAIGGAVGAPVDHQGPDDGSTVIA